MLTVEKLNSFTSTGKLRPDEKTVNFENLEEAASPQLKVSAVFTKVFTKVFFYLQFFTSPFILRVMAGYKIFVPMFFHSYFIIYLKVM